MKVAELAADLGVPPSTVIALCQRFGIDGAWAGAELSAADIIVLRAELASDDEPLDLTDPVAAAGAPSDDPAGLPVPEQGETEPRPAAAVPGESTALPPTAVGSLPGFDLAPDTPDAAGAGGFDFVGRSTRATPTTSVGAVKSAPVDRSVRSGSVLIVLALVGLAVSEMVANRWSVPALWAGSLLLLIAAAVAANRARRRADLHPEKHRWPWAGKVLLVLALAGLVGLGSLVWLVVRDEPARAAPMGLGELASVQEARWAYQRAHLLADNGWYTTAKDPGTCWRIDGRRDERTDRRVELGNVEVRCPQRHRVEVLSVFPADRDPDATFPGRDKLVLLGVERCTDVLTEALRPRKGVAPTGDLFVETPTAQAWADGDHDLSCVVLTPDRTQSLLEELRELEEESEGN